MSAHNLAIQSWRRVLCFWRQILSVLIETYIVLNVNLKIKKNKTEFFFELVIEIISLMNVSIAIFFSKQIQSETNQECFDGT